MKKTLCLIFAVLLLGTLTLTPASFAAAKEEKESAVRSLPFDLKTFFQKIIEDLLTPESSPSEPTETEAPTAEPETPATPLSRAEEYERRVWELVNAERAKAGLPALTYSTTLANGARAKSEDMRQNNYFAHESPTYGSPFDMMRSFGISYRAAGENIAMGYRTPEAVVNGWMDSPGHRANILSEKYSELGVGYVEEGNYWTQWFRG